jgi:hypothetical protein
LNELNDMEVFFDINSVKYRDHQDVRTKALEEITQEMSLSGMYFISV